MKAKHLIATLSLTLAMGLGVGASLLIRNQNEKQAKADVTLAHYYLDLTTSGSAGEWWRDSSALTYVYAYDSSKPTTDPTRHNANWPGAQITESWQKIYSFDLDSSFDKLIITRVNPENTSEIWTRSSKDGGNSIDLPNTTATTYAMSFIWTDYGSNFDDANYLGHWDQVEYDLTAHLKHLDDSWTTHTVHALRYGGIDRPAIGYGEIFNGYFKTNEFKEWMEPSALSTSITDIYAFVYQAKNHTYNYDFTGCSSEINVGGLQVRLHQYDADPSTDQFFTIDTDLIGTFNSYENVILEIQGINQIPHEGCILYNSCYTSCYSYDTLSYNLVTYENDQHHYYFLNWYTDNDVPMVDGHYVVISDANYRFDNRTYDDASNPIYCKMDPLENDPRGYVAQYLNYQFTWNNNWRGISVRSYFENKSSYHNLDEDDYSFVDRRSYSSWLDNDDNYVTVYYLKQSVNLNIYLKSDGTYHYEVCNGHAARVKYALFNPQFVCVDQNRTDSYIVYNGDEFSPEFEGEISINVGGDEWITGIPTEELYLDANCTQPYTPGELTSDITVYAKCYADGVYLIGDAHYTGSASTAWDIDSGIAFIEQGEGSEDVDRENHIIMMTTTMVADANIPLDTTRNNPTQVATLYMLEMFGGYQAYKTSPKYADFTLAANYDFVAIDSSVQDNMKLTFQRGGNFTISAAATISFQMDDDFREIIGVEIGVVITLIQLDNTGLNGFVEGFLNSIGNVCKYDGTTDVEALATAWNAQAQAFEALTASEKIIIRAVTINGGNEEGSALEQMIAKYALVLSRYSDLDDFIFGQQSGSNLVKGMNVDSQTMIVVIAAISMTSLLVVFGIKAFSLKRKDK